MNAPIRHRRPTVTKTTLRRAWKVLEEHGLAVTGARVCPNGDVLLLTGAAGAPVDAEASYDDEIEKLIRDEG